MPELFRKRLFIEGFYEVDIDGSILKELLTELSTALSMTPLIEPIIFSPTGRGKGLHRGYAAYMGWVESGVAIYTWEDKKFFSVDIYSCKEFPDESAVDVVKRVLKASVIEYGEFRYH
jgi:S-adenosylmethionine decarboxylase